MVTAAFPAGVRAPVQYGEVIRSWSVYYQNQHFIPEDYMDKASARFDLLSHDTDFCLQVFKMPAHTFVEEISI